MISAGIARAAETAHYVGHVGKTSGYQRLGRPLRTSTHLASEQQFSIVSKVFFYRAHKVVIGHHAHSFFVHDGYIKGAGWMRVFELGHGAHVDIDVAVVAV